MPDCHGDVARGDCFNHIVMDDADRVAVIVDEPRTSTAIVPAVPRCIMRTGIQVETAFNMVNT